MSYICRSIVADNTEELLQEDNILDSDPPTSTTVIALYFPNDT